MRRLACVGLALVLAACDRRVGADRVEPAAREGTEVVCADAAGDASACRDRVEALLAAGVDVSTLRGIERRVLARAFAERLHRDALAAGAPTPGEIERAAERAWPKHNDGPLVSVVHALFPTGPEADARAAAFARAVGASPTAEQFEAAAHAAGGDVVVERIEAIGNRGRTGSGSALERSFADAAVRLTTASPRSDGVHTSYGTHVILLLHRVEAPVVDRISRRNALASEAIAARARDRIDALVRNAAVRVEDDAPNTLRSLGKNQ